MFSKIPFVFKYFYLNYIQALLELFQTSNFTCTELNVNEDRILLTENTRYFKILLTENTRYFKTLRVLYVSNFVHDFKICFGNFPELSCMSNGITSLLFVMNGFYLLRFRLRLRLRTIYFNIPVEKNAGANCIVFAAG